MLLGELPLNLEGVVQFSFANAVMAVMLAMQKRVDMLMNFMMMLLYVAVNVKVGGVLCIRSSK